MVTPTTPTTHTPPGANDQPPRGRTGGSVPMPTAAAPRDYWHTQNTIDRVRKVLDDAETLLDLTLPAGHLDLVSNAVDEALRSVRQPVQDVRKWADARRYPPRREIDRVEFSEAAQRASEGRN